MVVRSPAELSAELEAQQRKLSALRSQRLMHIEQAEALKAKEENTRNVIAALQFALQPPSEADKPVEPAQQ